MDLTYLTAGDSVTWTCPADGPRTMYIAYKGQDPHNILATVADGVATFSINSSGWQPGIHTATLVQDNPRKTLSSWSLRVAPDPTLAFDRRTVAEQMLEAVEACLLGVASSPLIEMQMGDGVAIKNLSHNELRKLQIGLRAEVLQLKCGASALFRSVPV